MFPEIPHQLQPATMRRHLTEQTFIFLSVLKWVVLAAAIGVIVGASTTLFLKLLESSILLTARYRYYFALLPVAFLVSWALVRFLAPDAEGHGTEKVIEAVHKRSGRIKLLVVPVKLAATIVTIACGGSAGKEGPCAQIGGGLASTFADIFRFDDIDRKKLVICGISAGFAAVFGTPIAGAIFGVEVLFVGSILYEVLLPSFIAGITAYQVAAGLGVHYTYVPITFVPVFTSAFFIRVVLSGVFFGFCSMLLIEILGLGKSLAARLRLHPALKAVIGGGALALLVLAFTPRYLGLGLDTIRAALTDAPVPWYAFLVKSFFTSITLNFGGSGGIVTPIFFVGTTSGSLFAHLFGLHHATFAALGMVALLAGAANTPIAASIMAVEFFGPKIAPYATVACIVSFLMTGHRSVYPSQVLAVRKSPTVDVELGREMDDLAPQVRLGRSGIFRRGLRTLRFLRSLLRQVKLFERSGRDD